MNYLYRSGQAALVSEIGLLAFESLNDQLKDNIYAQIAASVEVIKECFDECISFRNSIHL